MSAAALPIRVFEEIADVIAAGADRDALLDYRPSPAVQERARELLARLKDDALTDEEREELDEFTQAESFLRLLKSRLIKEAGALSDHQEPRISRIDTD